MKYWSPFEWFFLWVQWIFSWCGVKKECDEQQRRDRLSNNRNFILSYVQHKFTFILCNSATWTIGYNHWAFIWTTLERWRNDTSDGFVSPFLPAWSVKKQSVLPSYPCVDFYAILVWQKRRLQFHSSLANEGFFFSESGKAICKLYMYSKYRLPTSNSLIKMGHGK